MGIFRRFFIVLLISSLLAACRGDPGLWGAARTPTPSAASLAQLSTPTAFPTPQPAATPLVVLPLPGSPTPGMAPTRALSGGGSNTLPVPQQSPTATLPPVNSTGPMDVYQTQGGDTLNIVATRFGLAPQQLITDIILPPADVLLPVGVLLLVPKPGPNEQRTPGQHAIPDSEIVFGPATIGFDHASYIAAQGGFLDKYKEYVLSGGWTTGAQAVERIALENSLNPRIILAIIEWESSWVRGQPKNLAADEYPLGYVDYHYRGLFRQLMWAAGTLSEGYYSWRSGTLTTLTFQDGSSLRLSPHLNAGTAAIQYYFAQTHSRAEWEQIVAPTGFPTLYAEMFGPIWERAQAFEPTLPNGLRQPELSLPFERGKIWAFSGGPHSAWEGKGALAALDFAPGSVESGCVKSDNWVLAPAPGVVARTASGVVMLDLDGDGDERTGWVILFLHIASEGKAKPGAILQADDKIGHPSCEGGISTGTHLHIARKFNGEWILADGPLPFDLDGWISRNGAAPYKGTLTKGDKIIEASTSGSFATRIIREKK
jgi:murein DD-endopeptidase MepM/ murein hydrolase activator NlpD